MSIEYIMEIISDLSDMYGISEATVESWFKELMEKRCVKTEDIYECLEEICKMKIQMQDEIEYLRRKREKINYNQYRYTNSYIINNAIYKVYDIRCYYSLDEEFIKYMGINPFEDINLKDTATSQIILDLQYEGKTGNFHRQ